MGGPFMNITYFKRFRMEIDLRNAPRVPALPEGFFWVPWDDSLVEVHAEVKFASFHGEIDSAVFPSLSDRQGCFYLMSEIRKKPGFLPQATWLVANADGYCGTVQGIRDRIGFGAIQNLGVTPAARGRGLGGALLLKALEGFRQAGIQIGYLEVTAQNDGAVRLYRRLGFRCSKTIYKAVDAQHSPAVPSTAAVPALSVPYRR
jgi:ribosomal protein S18 acetylase RimI-like enzyme